MVCKTLLSDKGEPSGFICSAPWGMGVYEVEGYGPVYGMGGSGDPHDFRPAEDENTPKEMAAWEAAKAKCKCGR